MQNPNNTKSSIELKSGGNVETFPKNVIIKSIVTVNAIALCASPIKPSNAVNFPNETLKIESSNNIDANAYPIKRIRCENGKPILDMENFEDGNTSVTLGVSNMEPTVNVKFQQVISDLRKENAMLKNRLKHSLPVHAIFYMVLNSIIFAIVGTLLVMRFLLNVYTIDPYYLICALIISCGLFFTALASLKDWKGNLLK